MMCRWYSSATKIRSPRLPSKSRKHTMLLYPESDCPPASKPTAGEIIKSQRCRPHAFGQRVFCWISVLVCVQFDKCAYNQLISRNYEKYAGESEGTRPSLDLILSKGSKLTVTARPAFSRRNETKKYFLCSIKSKSWCNFRNLISHLKTYHHIASAAFRYIGEDDREHHRLQAAIWNVKTDLTRDVTNSARRRIGFECGKCVQPFILKSSLKLSGCNSCSGVFDKLGPELPLHKNFLVCYGWELQKVHRHSTSTTNLDTGSAGGKCDV